MCVDRKQEIGKRVDELSAMMHQLLDEVFSDPPVKDGEAGTDATSCPTVAASESDEPKEEPNPTRRFFPPE